MENKFNGETVLLCRVQHYFCVALFLQRRGLTPQLHRIVSSGLLQTSQSIGHASLVNLKINQKSMWIQSKVQKPKLSIMNKSINIAFFLVLCCVSVGKFMCLKIITFAFPPKLTSNSAAASITIFHKLNEARRRRRQDCCKLHYSTFFRELFSILGCDNCNIH